MKGLPRRFLRNSIKGAEEFTQGGVGYPAGRVLIANTTEGLQAVIDRAITNDIIFCKPGRYSETVTVPRTNVDGQTLNNLMIVGLGGRGAAYIQPTTEDAAGMVIHADDVTLINLGVAAEDETSAASLTVTGSRFRADGCKFEAGLNQLVIGPGTDALITAGTRGRGGDAWIEDCEFCWGTNGLVLQSTDFGAATQIHIRNCWFHDLTGDCLDENDGGAIGAGKGCVVKDCVFDNAEDGTAPSKYVDWDSAGSAGVLTGNRFVTTVLAAAKIAIAADVLFVGNYAQAEGPATGGGTAGRPD